jgi:hypothetical protein
MEGAKPDDPADAELDLAWPMRRSSKSLQPWTSLAERTSPEVAQSSGINRTQCNPELK